MTNAGESNKVELKKQDELKKISFRLQKLLIKNFRGNETDYKLIQRPEE